MSERAGLHPEKRQPIAKEWNEWVSDIEGKAARVAAMECGQQQSFKAGKPFNLLPAFHSS